MREACTPTSDFQFKREIRQFQYNKVLHVYSKVPNNWLSPSEDLFNFWTFFHAAHFYCIPIFNSEERLIP